MIRWQFAANNNAIRTVVGDKVAEVIRLRSRQGCGLFGPYLDLPAGACTVRILLAGRHEGQVVMDIAANAGQMVLASRSLELPAQYDEAVAAGVADIGAGDDAFK